MSETGHLAANGTLLIGALLAGALLASTRRARVSVRGRIRGHSHSDSHGHSDSDSRSVGSPLLHSIRRLRARRGTDAYDAQLVRFVLSLGAALRAGNSVVAGLEAAAEPCEGKLADELDALVGRVRRGWTVREAIERWERDASRTSVRMVAGAILLGGATGGRLSDALDSVAATVATQLELDAERRALSSQARASAALLVLAPIGFSLIAAVIDPRVGRGLFATPIGLASAAIAIGLDALGWRWMRSIVRSAA